MSILLSIGLWRLGCAVIIALCWTSIVWMLAAWTERERAARSRMAEALKAQQDEMLTEAQLDAEELRIRLLLQSIGLSPLTETYSAPDAEERMRGGMARGGRA